MPDFRVSPISIVNQIKSNLQDRYASGYPILKELLQNADDSGVLEAPNGIIWRLVSPEITLRPLPKSVADAPVRIGELFADIHSWAESRNTFLCVDKSTSLTAEPMRWTADDLGSLFSFLSPRAFQSGALAPLLAEFLASVESEGSNRRAVGPHLVSALRKAMSETSPLASSEHVLAILAHVPGALLFPLPASVEHRQVLRSLAAAPAGVLPVRDTWVGDAHRHPQLSDTDLKALLGALEPHIDGDNADQAATATLALLMHAEQDIVELARQPDYAAIKVLRARDLRAGGIVALSLQTLIERSKAGLLFASSPDANRVLPLLVDALPEASPLIVEGKTAEFLKETGGSTLSLHSAGKDTVFALINTTSRFGPDDARSRLLERLRPVDDDDRLALRRLCAGAQAAGYANADIWILEGAPRGVERIVTNILSKSESDFLISSRIAAELTPKLRNYLGIRALDTAGLEALLEKYLDAIPDLQPTDSEREAFLQTDLPASLLRRMPIHARSDGTIGDAENIFHEADWPIPVSLREHVLTVRPCNNSAARKRQQSLVPAWCPRSQLKIALSRTEPHLVRTEILDALAKLSNDKSELEPPLWEALRITPWLMAEGAPIAPEYVLALPVMVDELARSVLLRDNQPSPFLPARKLSIDVREHSGFAHLERRVLPDQRSSFEALALMIEDAGIIGRLGPVDDYPIEDLTTLASDGADLKLPGWVLLAAVLTSLRDDRDQAVEIIAAFSELSTSNADLAAGHLDSLARLAEEKGWRSEAARRAYLRGFEVVATWPEDAQRKVFSGARVPNEAGGWRSGREVIENGEGIAPTHLLAREYASKLRKHDTRSAQSPNQGASDPVVTVLHRREIKSIDLAKLENHSAAQQREFLRGWRGRVPSDLVIIYLGLIGRYPALKDLASEWAADATTDVDTLWADLDRRLKPTLSPNPLPTEVDERRFQIQQIAGEHVRATAMSGDLFDAPLSDPTDAVVRAQAHAIASVNDQWGVFSRSRVQLLPHQLWVCRKVNQEWPFRWLVADDVGLGKTIECGLVLMPLMASGRVRRVLILAPAKLVPQWQFRLKDMFDIRLQRYVTEADTQRGDFWATASMVVASFHTLRDDRRGARQRLLDADPWDLVIVDEAHHLSVDEKTGETLAYSLVSDLEKRKRINSLLFFTGTPHRGKDFGFFGLMHLVRPDLFDPEGDKVAQLAQLPRVMIRNNKASVTDLQGGRLFKPINVFSREYGYSAEESGFYRTLSEFILDGRAYARTLDGRAQTARMLVLIALQKLAASSIAAIRSALRKRRVTLTEAVNRSSGAAAVDLPEDEEATLDEVAEAEEALPSSAAIMLMEDEIHRLDELIALSEGIVEETKIERLLLMIRDEFSAEEPVLLFTEYKATQALVVNALHRHFGFGSATFINGDERLDGLERASGAAKMVSQPREHAADAFNAGKVRFLVSTEAGGEGIDLQERCAVLVHVDMPWNPMRLHQRVGRLSRYGQQRPVSVYILRNPETVEARIWDLLNEKLERIQLALSSVMEEQEDISQLVIGMTGSSVFNELFSGAQGLSSERLGAWFDQATATLGGRDVVETARELLGNVSRFDFQQVGKDLPKVDLQDLEKFFTQVVSRHGRRVFRRDDGLEIKSPDEWKARSYAVREKYEGLVFDRSLRGTNVASRVLGVGHILFDIALDEARKLPAGVALVDGITKPLLIVSVEDEVTGTGSLVHRLIFGITEKEDNFAVLRDWELLQVLNSMAPKSYPESGPTDVGWAIAVDRLKKGFDTDLSAHAPTLHRPVSWPEMLFLPSAQATRG